MKAFWTLLTLLGLLAFLPGCGNQADQHSKTTDGHMEATAGKQAESSADPEVRANLAKLSPGDRKLAEAQRYCAVDSENLLGSMDVPVKIMVKDQPVFLCCKGCKKRALADSEKTIAKVNELKEKTSQPSDK
jgi:hypothetical protein